MLTWTSARAMMISHHLKYDCRLPYNGSSAWVKARRVIALCIAALAVGGPVRAGMLGGSIGVDCAGMVDGSTTRATSASLGIQTTWAMTIEGVLFDNSEGRSGLAASTTLDAPVGPLAQMRAVVTRVADHGAATQLRWSVGPMLKVSQSIVGMFYTRGHLYTAEVADQGSLMFAREVAYGLTSRSSLGAGFGNPNVHAWSLTTGLAWVPYRSLVLSGDVGWSSVMAAGTPASSSAPLGQPLLADGSATNAARGRSAATGSLGLRWYVP